MINYIPSLLYVYPRGAQTFALEYLGALTPRLDLCDHTLCIITHFTQFNKCFVYLFLLLEVLSMHECFCLFVCLYPPTIFSNNFIWFSYLKYEQINHLNHSDPDQVFKVFNEDDSFSQGGTVV